ncbi:MAG TPA: sodium:proton antiporter [Phycisphaerae bacterium]|nr:sodium:proton antiporter [Phycisphaerae bacterium]
MLPGDLSGQSEAAVQYPGVFWILPFVLLLLGIAVFPLLRGTHHWWEKNTSKLMIAGGLGLVTLAHYYLRGYGIEFEGHLTTPGWLTVRDLLVHSVLGEYIPFISLLFSLYVIAGGICVRGDLPAGPRTNVGLLAVGGLLASFIGTTGASMLLIRPLLRANAGRRRVAHTVVFFIFIVSNVGGLLLPIGDPPLFLGYLRGVPFLWTLNLWREWAFTFALLLAIYWIWDVRAFRIDTPHSPPGPLQPVLNISVAGKINFLLLASVVLATGTLDPSKDFLGTGWRPFLFCRELVQIALAALSLWLTPRLLREENRFNYAAILEVACLFIGIFICMQVPIEILNVEGPGLNIKSPARFFWACGSLSSLLDNAPTYVVFLETAKTLVNQPGTAILELTGGGNVHVDHLAAISLGAVFMGANTYIGNGPNFMVKSIAEHAGVKMPSFFGYMVYSICVLLPIFVVVTFLFIG